MTTSGLPGVAPVASGLWMRLGWKVLLALVLVIGLFGVGDLIQGLDADPAIPEGIAGLSPDEIRETSPEVARLADLQVRSGGVHLLVMSILWTLIVLGPFRRREQWAWWAMWTFPAWALSVGVMFLFVDLTPGQPTPPPAISGWVFLGLTSLLLVAVRNAFFAYD